MPKRIAIIPTMMAMLMVLFTTAVPHHHHQAMICLVHEVCVMDGCCDDEHTMHSDPNNEEEETHCVSHEKYCPADDLRVDFTAVTPPAIKVPVPVKAVSLSSLHPQDYLKASSSPPISTWRINC
ncbi:MAG: hypothetical protein IJ205_08645 [Bacteroidales bacterium]|nr:hypothetical protein [Bacteroidales bacterium]